MEKGELQVKNFTRKGNNYSIYELSKELNDPSATIRLNFIALSDDDNVQNKVLNAFFNDKRPSIIVTPLNTTKFTDIDTSGKGASLLDKFIQLDPFKFSRAYLYDLIGLRMGNFVKLSEEESGLEYIYDNGIYIKTLVFDENSAVSRKLKENPTFKKYLNGFWNRIGKVIIGADKNIKENIFNGIISNETIIPDAINLKKDNILGNNPNFSNSSEILSYDYYALMGGTQKIKTEMTIEHRIDGKYKVKITMYIMDWYGSDNDDIKPENYKLDKKNIDSASVQNYNSTTLKHENEYWGEIEFYLSNRGYYEHGFMGCEGKSIGFFLSLLDCPELSLRYIRTDSKYRIFPTDVNTPPNPKNYKYQLDIKGDSAIVTIDYREFNTDILQQFLNVVTYYKDDIPIEKNGVNTYISHPNPPIIYILKNKRNDNIEVIINYHYKKSSRFTIEII